MTEKILHYQEIGVGKSVIMLHGLAASNQDWIWLAPDLVKSGFKAYFPDLPGHGFSPGPEDSNNFNVDYIFKKLITWITQTKIPKPIILIGHSLGAYLGIRLVQHYGNQISKLVLVSPLYTPNQIFFLGRYAMRYPLLSEQAIRLTNIHIVNFIMALTEPITGKYRPKARMQTALDYTQTEPASMRIPASTNDLSPFLEQILCPTLVIWGKRDPTLNPKYQADLVRKIPNAQGYSFPGCGHEPHLTQTKKFNQLVLSFL